MNHFKLGGLLIALGIVFGNIAKLSNSFNLHSLSIMIVWIGIIILFYLDVFRKKEKKTEKLTVNVEKQQTANPQKVKEEIKFYNSFCFNNGKKDNNADKDEFGNLVGNKFDLAKDGSFTEYKIAILSLIPDNWFGFNSGKIGYEDALKEKGFEIHKWGGIVPSIQEFKDVLAKSCQLWIISNSNIMLTNEHLNIIKEFFDKKNGVYIWGDNNPLYADANKVATYLFNGYMSGDSPGNHNIYAQKENKKVGFVKSHLIMTGIDSLFEGSSVATIHDNPDLQPILYGSADNVVISVFDKNGKRAILDGGFTRLYSRFWNSAGTGRYVKNAAAFLANIENRLNFSERIK